MATAKIVKPTKKNSPAIVKPRVVHNEPAAKYAKPHRMDGAPLHMRDTLGIDPDKDFKSIAFSGAHDATVAFVASGKADAGALNTSVWDKLSDAKNPNAEKVKVFYTTPPYHDYNWTVRGGLDAALVKKISDAFLKLNVNDPSQKELMDLQRATKYIPTKSSNYDEIEKAAIGAGLIK